MRMTELKLRVWFVLVSFVCENASEKLANYALKVLEEINRRIEEE